MALKRPNGRFVEQSTSANSPNPSTFRWYRFSGRGHEGASHESGTGRSPESFGKVMLSCWVVRKARRPVMNQREQTAPRREDRRPQQKAHEICGPGQPTGPGYTGMAPGHLHAAIRWFKWRAIRPRTPELRYPKVRNPNRHQRRRVRLGLLAPIV